MWTTFNGAPATARSWLPSRATGGRRSRRPSRSRRLGRRRRRPRTSIRRSADGNALRRLRRRLRHEEQEPRRPRLRHQVSRRRQDVRARSCRRRRRARTRTAFLPNTNFRDGIIENFAASPTYPGHALPDVRGLGPGDGQFDVKFTQSTDGGAHVVGAVARERRRATRRRPTSSSRRSRPARAARSRSRSTTAAQACPSDPSVLPGARRRGRTRASTSRCRPTRTRDGGRRGAGRRQRPRLAVHVGSRPAAAEGGRDHPVPVRRPHTTRARSGRGFIGDYFGLAISEGNIYTLVVSTHYPSQTVDRGRRRPGLLPAAGAGKVPRTTSAPGLAKATQGGRDRGARHCVAREMRRCTGSADHSERDDGLPPWWLDEADGSTTAAARRRSRATQPPTSASSAAASPASGRRSRCASASPRARGGARGGALRRRPERPQRRVPATATGRASPGMRATLGDDGARRGRARGRAIIPAVRALGARRLAARGRDAAVSTAPAQDRRDRRRGRTPPRARRPRGGGRARRASRSRRASLAGLPPRRVLPRGRDGPAGAARARAAPRGARGRRRAAREHARDRHRGRRRDDTARHTCARTRSSSPTTRRRPAGGRCAGT